MSKRPVDLLIEDILEAVKKVERYSEGMTQETFENDDRTIDAVVRNLEIIGEAANRLPDDFKTEHPEIEWTKIVGLRHRIVHEYFGVDLYIVWHILRKDLPLFKQMLNSIFKGY
ncbi:MAG: DUF86 domain-containing protein [Candidatus Desulfaltia sp.]|nr:DUF86 domain-containing protein [Candidatus Desulfaltia sp.]